jgi:hypothetical protein
LGSRTFVNGNVPTCGWYATSHVIDRYNGYGVPSRIRNDILKGIKNFLPCCTRTSMDMCGMNTSWLEPAEMKGRGEHLALRIPLQISLSRGHILKRRNGMDADVLSLVILGIGGETHHREQCEYEHKRDTSPNHAALVAKHNVPHPFLSFFPHQLRGTLHLCQRQNDLLVSRREAGTPLFMLTGRQKPY